uniref:Uncharacterized protein n=1 Tax=Romanomermis culicivorax TaxID=13658 RepID=A0A915I5L8_ROMCU
MFIAVYHIYMHLVEKSAAMKPFDCFKYVGTTYIFMHFSYWMVLLTSIDRSIAIFSPNFYKTGEHTAILNKIVILIACFELAELFAFYIDNFAQEFLLFCSVTSAMGVHSQFYATLVNTTLSVISPTIYCICFAYLLFQRYQKRANFSADLVAVKRRLKNRVTWSLAFMATWQVMTIAIASAYSFLCYNLAYNGGKAPSRFAGCLVFMSGTMFFVGVLFDGKAETIKVCNGTIYMLWVSNIYPKIVIMLSIVTKFKLRMTNGLVENAKQMLDINKYLTTFNSVRRSSLYAVEVDRQLRQIDGGDDDSQSDSSRDVPLPRMFHYLEDPLMCPNLN